MRKPKSLHRPAALAVSFACSKKLFSDIVCAYEQTVPTCVRYRLYLNQRVTSMFRSSLDAVPAAVRKGKEQGILGDWTHRRNPPAHTLLARQRLTKRTARMLARLCLSIVYHTLRKMSGEICIYNISSFLLLFSLSLSLTSESQMILECPVHDTWAAACSFCFSQTPMS